ncbi:MAG TPA: ATP-binding protein, partial [Candidatus Omnitrophota bacterium]|nr:ATP-binding protein [Candidatus Omnitrophota bacterium]
EKLKQVQAELLQAEKLDAIGRLATGIAHEVKNPLGIIMQCINYFEIHLLRENDEARRIFKITKDNVARASDIIRALLNFARATELRLEKEDANALFDNSLFLVKHIATLESITVVKDYHKNLPKVSVDKGKMEHVFINLFTNAIEAMPSGGTMTLRTYLRRIDELDMGVQFLTGTFFRNDEKVVVMEVEDTGEGISEQDLNKIFEPFFTTKDTGKGTGLGLPIAKSIVEMNKGYIKLDSLKGKGTKVSIYFRAAD